MTNENTNNTTPESDNEDYEYLVFELSLAKDLAYKVINEATEMGLGPEDWMKFIIGAVATNRMRGVYLTEQVGLNDIPSKESIEEGAQRIGGMIRHVMAITGNLNCEQCTQRLTAADLKRGHCNHCEAPIDE